MDKLPAKRYVGRYELIRQIGKGSFGVVYEAMHTGSAQLVAIKVISKAVIRAKNIENRVANEGSLHAKLSHPYILKLFESFSDEDAHYFIMELCGQGDLRHYLKKKATQLSCSQIRNIMVQLLEGLLYLHNNNIVHRDIKLSNLLLSNSMDLRIADFGLAKQLCSWDEKCGTICGTPNYIAPEILTHQVYGTESDLWSLGVVFYILLTKKSPFEGHDFRSGAWQCIVPPEIPDQARDLVTRLLQVDPSHRISLNQALAHPFITGTLLLSRPIERTGPLSTSRLKSLILSTKWGKARIDDIGNVILELPRALYSISSDGLVFRVFTSPSSCSPLAEYSFYSLPPKYIGWYRLAVQFVNTVRKKTPKVSFYAQYCRACLMESMVDFEVYFPGKGKLIYCQGDNKWKIGKIDSPLSSWVNYADLLLTKCLAFAKASEESDFPIAVYQHHSAHNELGGFDGTFALSPTPSLASPSMMSTSSSKSTIGSFSSKSASSQSSKHFWTSFIAGVGWAIRIATDRPTNVIVQFCDGIKLVISPDCASVELTDPKGINTHHLINDHTPIFVREKLEYLPAFLALMRQTE